MFSNLINEFNDTDHISVKIHGALPALISNSNKYTIVILDHEGSIELNFETYNVSGNYILFLCPNEVLKVSEYNSLMCICFSEGSRLKTVDGFNYLYGNVHKIFELSEDTFNKMKVLHDNINELLGNRPRSWSEKVIHNLLEIFRLSPSYDLESNSKDFSLIYNFIGLVHEHYTMHHEMAYYSRLLGTPSKKITEKFFAMEVMTPHAYIKQRIITEVKRQLLYTNKAIKTICFDVGFNDPAYFARFFKKNTGMTTKEFRSGQKS